MHEMDRCDRDLNILLQILYILYSPGEEVLLISNTGLIRKAMRDR